MDEIILNYDHVIKDLHSAVVQRKVDGSAINMLIMKNDCKSQRLISFDLPDEHCTIADLLNKVNTKFSLLFFLISKSFQVTLTSLIVCN